MYPINIFSILCKISFSGGDWIGLNYVSGGADWEVRLVLDLAFRPDINRINTSPITAVTPITRVQAGCNHTITIPGMFSITAFYGFILVTYNIVNKMQERSSDVDENAIFGIYGYFGMPIKKFLGNNEFK